MSLSSPVEFALGRAVIARRLVLPLALAMAVILGSPSVGSAADPESKVKPSAPRPAPSNPAPSNPAPSRPRADANDPGDPNDRGGTGPNLDRKVEKAPDSAVIRDFPEGSPVWVVRQAFRCALDHDESSGFECYVPLHVETNRNNDNALQHLRRYQWAHFRKWAATYPEPGKVFAIRQSRQVPEKLEATHKEVKLFFVSRNRDNPAPIILRREAGSWRIYSSSL